MILIHRLIWTPLFYPLKTWNDIQTFFIQTTQPLLKPQNLIGNRCLCINMYIYTYSTWWLFYSCFPTCNTIATIHIFRFPLAPSVLEVLREALPKHGHRCPGLIKQIGTWRFETWSWILSQQIFHHLSIYVSSCAFFLFPLFSLFFSDSPYFDYILLVRGHLFRFGCPDSSSLPSSPNFPTHRGSSWSRKKSSHQRCVRKLIPWHQTKTTPTCARQIGTFDICRRKT